MAGKHRFNPVPIAGQVLYRAGSGWTRVTQVRSTARKWQRVVDGITVDGTLRTTWVVSV